ncbi:ABC transporter ATP-binding protein [Streptococcus equinus]|uniref:ABC-2 type transport system ATP-binding protein n=1 Tax=Streptococcus equinus TaxID=1335 RepID=A0AAE8HJT2_STREI|nr:ABC transporter ATP-binding protein [Streptococcus equinus]SDW34053.1 ABC-2 type transport system ATP-binding protein [Streptococcus equinus]
MQIQIKHIKKVFKDKEVLNDISFTIESGSICGLLGVNGAGKSTLMKILYGLESQSAGEILFDGKTSKEIKDDKKFGALIESPAIYMNLSAFDNLKTKALLYDIPDETIRETLNLIGLANTGRKKAGNFSLGMKQRLGLGMAIITNPEFLILDEPTNGLDPDGIKELLDLINSLKQKGMTILISSHQLHEVSKIADDIVILHQGKIHYNQPNHDKQDLEKLFFSIVHGGYEK